MEKTVSILKCEKYEYDIVREKIKKSLDNIGGIEKFIKPNDKVLLKINLLMKKHPDNAVTTHPVFVKALASLVMEAGGVVTIADSPGGLYNETALRSVYGGCMIDDVAKDLGVGLNYDTSFEAVSYPAGKKVKTFQIIKPVLDADVIIDVPKLKTHMMTFYTGAVKNMFGAVPGAYKAEYHSLFPKCKDFCSMLVDLCCLTKPTLTVMDAIDIMEGEGPSSGQKRHLGAVLASASPYALDLAATALVGMTPKQVYTLSECIKRGLCPASVDELELVGDSFDEIKIDDLVMPKINSTDLLDRKFIPKRIAKAINSFIAPKPHFKKDVCVGCGECMRRCPEKAIEMKDNFPVVDEKKCIHCFCCQELCPKKAIISKRHKIIEFILKH